MRELCPACPPVAWRSTSTVRRPSDAPYTADAQPCRATADDDQVVEVLGRLRGEPDGGGDLGVAGRAQRRAVGGDQHRDVLRPGARRLQQPRPLRLVDRVVAVGHGVAGEEVAGREALRRPAVADDADLVDRALAHRPPRLDQRVDDRVELLLRRVPRLEQVVVDVDQVDRLDRRVGVGVGGEQGPAGVRGDVHGLLEELDAVHLRHAVVGEDRRHRLAAQRELAQRVERVAAGLGADDPVVLAVAATQVASHGTAHPRVVVDGQQDGLCRARLDRGHAGSCWTAVRPDEGGLHSRTYCGRPAPGEASRGAGLIRSGENAVYSTGHAQRVRVLQGLG